MTPRSMQSILGTFIDNSTQGKLVMRKKTIVHAPTGKLVISFDIVEGIMYISQSVFRSWLIKNNQDDLSVVRGLLKDGVVKDAGLVCLGKGTLYEGVPQLAYSVRIPFTGES